MFSKETGILSRQLFRRILILSLIGVFGLIFAIAVTLFSTLRNIESQLASTGQTAAHTFDQFLSQLSSDLLATGDTLPQTDNTNTVFRHALERQFAIFELILLDPQGQILEQRRRAGTSELTEITEQPWLATIQTGEVYIGSVDFEEFGVPFVDMAVAVTDNQGQFMGTLLARVDMTTLWDQVIRQRVGQTGYSYITNQSGQLLAYRDLQLVRNGVEVNLMAGDINPLNNLINLDFDIYQGVSGPTVAGTVQQLQSVPWFVVVEQPVGEALRPFVLQGLVLLAALLIVVALVVGIVNFVRHQIVLPLQLLRQGVDFLTQGELEHRIEVQTKNELGALANAFNSLAAQLNQFIGTLEERIHERTQALGTSAEISRQITGILDLNELLRYVVNRLQADFGFYHTHVYLIDDVTGDLEMVEGSGQVGQQLKAQGHRLQIGQGIVGNVVRTGAPFLSENVDNVPNFFRNPLLPNTRSELSVPIRRSERILGVLDAQSEEIDGFSQEDLTLLQSIADQVAVAVDNARLFQEVQEAAAEAKALNRRLTRETWQDVSEQVKASGYVFTRSGVALASSEWLPGMVQAVKQKKLAMHSVDGNGSGSDETATSVAIPLSLRGEAIGAIGIERPADKAWTEDEVSAVEAIADQITRALENARLSEEQEKTIEQLKEVDRLKSEFLTSMSHELRTPLNSIIGFADVLLQGIDGELNELALNDIQLIYSSGQHLLALINDILDLSKIEAGQMELVLEPVDIRATIQDALSASKTLLKDKSVEVIVDTDKAILPAYADKLRLNQVLLNLVSNAAKFTDEGRITIRAEVDSEQPDKMRIAVIDTGIGISPDKLETIFDRFHQADSSTARKYGGTGLGLAICKQLVELHGGELKVRSQEGEGAEFFFTIPLVTEELIEE